MSAEHPYSVVLIVDWSRRVPGTENEVLVRQKDCMAETAIHVDTLRRWGIVPPPAWKAENFIAGNGGLFRVLSVDPDRTSLECLAPRASAQVVYLHPRQYANFFRLGEADLRVKR